MPIFHAETPSDAHAVLRKHLPQVLLGPGGHRHGGKPVQLDDVHLSDAHRGFHFGLDDLRADEDPLTHAKLSVYRFFVFDDEDIIGIAQVATRDGAYFWAGLTSGPTVDAKVRTLVGLEQMVEELHPDVDFEFRGLHIPAVRFAAIWLVATTEDGETDSILVPIQDHPSGLAGETMYAWPQVRDALRATADEAHGAFAAAVQLPPDRPPAR